MEIIQTLLAVYSVFRAEVRMFDTWLTIATALLVLSLVASYSFCHPMVPLTVAIYGFALFYRNLTSLFEKLRIVDRLARTTAERLTEPPHIFVHETHLVESKSRKAGDTILFIIVGPGAGIWAIIRSIDALVR